MKVWLPNHARKQNQFIQTLGLNKGYESQSPKSNQFSHGVDVQEDIFKLIQMRHKAPLSVLFHRETYIVIVQFNFIFVLKISGKALKINFKCFTQLQIQSCFKRCHHTASSVLVKNILQYESCNIYYSSRKNSHKMYDISFTM